MQILSLKRLLLAIFVWMICVNHTHIQAQPLQPLQSATCSTKGVIMCAWWDRITRDLHDEITVLVLTQNNQNTVTFAFKDAILADATGCALSMGQTFFPDILPGIPSPGAAELANAILTYFVAGVEYLTALTITGDPDQTLATAWANQGTNLAETTVLLLTGLGPILPGPVPAPNPVFVQLDALIQALIGAQIAEMNIYNDAALNGTPTFGPSGINDAFQALTIAGEIGFFIGSLVP